LEVSLGKEWIIGLLMRPEKRVPLLEMTGQTSLPNAFGGGTVVGGLYSGRHGLVPALEWVDLMTMVEEAERAMRVMS
jgi:hypothetical protein